MSRSTILTTATRILLPLMLLFGFYILVRGHNDPGGGIIAAHKVGAALDHYGLAEGMDKAKKEQSGNTRWLIGVGLLLILLSGLIAPIFTNGPFLLALWGSTELPAFGKPGTPLLFDIGVDLAVIGVTLLIIFSLAENEEEEA